MLDISDLGFSEEELQALAQNIDQLDPEEAAEVERLLSELEKRQAQEAARDDLIAFCQYMQPDYKVGRHHRVLADQLMALEHGSKDRAIVNMPPRHGKSQLVSIYFPAWFIGRNPMKKVMMVSHTTDLAVDFGRKVRNLVDDPKFKDIFPDVSLSADSKSAGRWSTNKGGEYFACGVGSSLAGRGADILLCVRNDMLIPTSRGYIRADEVRPEDKLLTHKGFLPVSRIATAHHELEVSVDGAVMSSEHPVWTFNRGWVEAGKLTTRDLLYTMNLTQHMGVLYGRLTHNTRTVIQSGLQYLGHDAAKVQQSERSKLRSLWGPRDILRAGVGKLRKILRGYGAPTILEAHAGSGGQQWPLQSGELPVGGRRTATEQPQELPEDLSVRENLIHCAVGTEDWVESRSGAVPGICHGDAAGRSAANRTYELGAAPRRPEDCGWLRNSIFRLYRICRESNGGAARNLVGAFEVALGSAVCGLLLGIRKPRSVEVSPAAPGAHFIDFTVPGANTFFINQWMTHNCDDPHSEQDILNGNFEIFDKAYQWFTFGARTRLMPGGRVAVVQTRWHLDDLSGRLVRDMSQNEGADQYEVVEFPAILETKNDDGDIIEKALWPEVFDLQALHRTKASMPVFQWNAQYQQNPTAEGAALVKRDWWRKWQDPDPPDVDYVIMSLDTATEVKERADYTAMTVWGVFFNEEEHANHLILLDSIRKRVEFPELKKLAVENYRHWKPDAFIVEKKNSGVALFQELRRTGMLLQEYMPTRATGNKYVRLQSVADIVAAGVVWVPETRWAEELVEEIAAFPVGSHDDLVDSAVMALMRFRQGGFLRLPTDDDVDTEDGYVPYRAAYY